MLQSYMLQMHYNPELLIVIAADTPNYGIGAVILYIYPDGSEKVVAQASRLVAPEGKNYEKLRPPLSMR